MNIVYGGAFNPPTIAHYEITKYLKSLGNVILLPVGVSYPKESLINDSYRLEMVKIMAQKLDVSYSEIELFTKEFKGTYESLKYLQNSYNDLYFVIGADNLINLDKWINAQKLLEEFKFIVFTRDDFNCEEIICEKYSSYSNHFIIKKVKYNISSTEIRNDIMNNKNNIIEDVYEYIENNNLYGVKNHVK